MMTSIDGSSLSLFTAMGLTVLSVAAAPGAARAGGMAEPIVQVTMNDYMEDLCARTDLTRADLGRLRNSADFGDTLAYTLEHCPELAALLSDQATATIPAAGNAKDDDRRSVRGIPGGGDGGGDGDDEGDGDGDGDGGDGEGGDGEGGDGEGGGKKDGPGKRVDGPGKRIDGPGRRNRGQDGAPGGTAGEGETNQDGGR